MSSAFTPAQRQRATALYRSLLRTTRQVFRDDARAIAAARDETRRRFAEAKHEKDATKIDEGLEMGEQVTHMLKHNVVQGVANPEDERTYKLRFTEHTELGSNDTIKQARPAPSLSEIQRTKGKNKQIRAFSTGRSTMAAPKEDEVPLPRPVPRFPSIVILADGSSVRLTTTSPRYLSRMARDYTNHPLWNPAMDRRSDAAADDDTGRLGRFRRRFAEEQAAASAQAAVSFDEDDLSWMSGGREARPGAPVQAKKGKGKGRK
ncbi:mitochondrial respiratory chain complex III protein [Malassezia pachydermatis]|uniref:Mitochondrial zinc maintenance protein 1, mitochondrial n=1 Tax=Malassezia pachydermatis TaxID=77020 RepID=A0A0M9VMQ6_9BASI|nr:hypothetical protein Malapachy_2824 [Malassezia pachydermatis]KOS12513.1 hypothetical protein Malapachy_2824 [Malassezia pachydermatis]